MKEKQSQYDKMTKTPVSTLVFRLSIPTTISMLVTNIYNMADTFFVGKIDTSASGAISVVFGLMAILQAVGFMCGHGSGSNVSRFLGGGHKEKASEYASTGFAMALALGLVIGVLGLIFIEPLMVLLGSTDTILPYARDYGKYILMAAPLMVGSFSMNNILRYEGLAAKSMIGLTFGGVLNIFLDYIFTIRLNMGTSGAGMATALSQTVSFFLLLRVFIAKESQSVLSVKNITRDFGVVKNIIETGIPNLCRQGLNSVSTMVLNRMAKPFGDSAIAAMGIVGKVNFFVFAIALGLGQGFQPVSSFNYGAKKYSRVKKAFWFTVGLSEVFLGIMMVAVLVFSEPIIGFMRSDPDVIAFGSVALRWQSIALIVQPVGVCGNMMFQSCGKKMLAALTAVLRSGVYFIPVIIILSKLFGAVGIQIAQPIADLLMFLTSIPLVFKFLKELPKEDEACI